MRATFKISPRLAHATVLESVRESVAADAVIQDFRIVPLRSLVKFLVRVPTPAAVEAEIVRDCSDSPERSCVLPFMDEFLKCVWSRNSEPE